MILSWLCKGQGLLMDLHALVFQAAKKIILVARDAFFSDASCRQFVVKNQFFPVSIVKYMPGLHGNALIRILVYVFQSSLIPLRIFSEVIGISVILTPVAL